MIGREGAIDVTRDSYQIADGPIVGVSGTTVRVDHGVRGDGWSGEARLCRVGVGGLRVTVGESQGCDDAPLFLRLLGQMVNGVANQRKRTKHGREHIGRHGQCANNAANMLGKLENHANTLKDDF